MAVLFAVFLWWAVVNIDDPIGTQKYQVEVTVVNTEIITNSGKSYKILNDDNRVVVEVTARRKVLDKIKASDIKATADLKEMHGDSMMLVPIRVTIQGFEGSYSEATTNPKNIQIQTEDTQKKTFTIDPVAVGEVREGYEVGVLSASPETIDISGPKSILGRIAKVAARVDVSELAKDSTMTASLIYYDTAGNIIDKSQLSSNCDKNGVSVDVTMYEIKTIGLNFDTSQINPGEGYLFSGLEVEPQEIQVAGLKADLAALQQLNIPGEALQMSDITENTEKVVDVAQYLPEGIKLAGEAVEKKIVVRVKLEKVGTKSILLPVRSINLEGVAEDLELTYGPEQEVELQFSGANEVLESLTSEKILAQINLSEYTEEGTYDVPVQIIDSPDQCDYLGGVTVQIILTRKE